MALRIVPARETRCARLQTRAAAEGAGRVRMRAPNMTSVRRETMPRGPQVASIMRATFLSYLPSHVDCFGRVRNANDSATLPATCPTTSQNPPFILSALSLITRRSCVTFLFLREVEFALAPSRRACVCMRAK